MFEFQKIPCNKKYFRNAVIQVLPYKFKKVFYCPKLTLIIPKFCFHRNKEIWFRFLLNLLNNFPEIKLNLKYFKTLILYNGKTAKPLWHKLQ